MIDKAQAPAGDSQSAGVHLILRVLRQFPPYRWTQARLLRC